jgi:hypothetical protein
MNADPDPGNEHYKKNLLNGQLNVNFVIKKNEITFSHFMPITLLFILFKAFFWLRFFLPFCFFLDLLDPDPGGHRMRIRI